MESTIHQEQTEADGGKMEQRFEDMFNDRAFPERDGQREVLCPHCEEALVFGMRDKAHEFSIGLSSILECVVIAEHMGYIPSFPDEWWVSLVRRYPALSEIQQRLESRKDEP